MINLDLVCGKRIQKVHFIGIDGISMSGLAEILLYYGFKVTGSDMKTSNKTRKLERLGAIIHTGHSSGNISDQDLIVYSAAIKKDNPEMIKAAELNIPTMDRATLLGKIMKNYPYAVAVSGTHGKTTTTSMISAIFLEAGLDPTIHIGAELESIGGATKIGGGRFFVAEACEYCGSFLKFYPYLAVILNIEYDHADYFRDIDHIKEYFLRFARLVPPDGYVIACLDDENVRSILDQIDCNVVTFGIKNSEAGWRAENISFDDSGCASFTAKSAEISMPVKLSIPGIHNVYNSLAAIASASILGCSNKIIARALQKFTGANRRFELKGTVDGIQVIDDYAHHPSEIKATLKALKNFKSSRVWCVFQPHTYSRTKALLEDFAGAFEDADNIILADIYAAREKDNGEINSGILAEHIRSKGRNAKYIPKFEDIVKFLKNNVKPGDLVITMGAGDIDKVGELFLNTNNVVAV